MSNLLLSPYSVIFNLNLFFILEFPFYCFFGFLFNCSKFLLFIHCEHVFIYIYDSNSYNFLKFLYCLFQYLKSLGISLNMD